MYGVWMMVTKPLRGPAKQMTRTTGGEAAPPLTQSTNQLALMAVKNKEKIAQNQGSRYSIVTEHLEDLNDAPTSEIICSILKADLRGSRS